MPTAVVAVGGNFLAKDKNSQTVPQQYSSVVRNVRSIADMIEEGWNIVITHGNGPQVGFILLRSEIAHRQCGLHKVPLDFCVADSQGAIGYIFQQTLKNEFNLRKIKKESLTVVTRVLVDINDPAFKNPSKPIGPFMEKKEAMMKKNIENWDVVNEPGRGWRRVVPSPFPREILEQKAIESLIKEGFFVIAGGGGGIPVYKKKNGIIAGVEAVVDKDLSSALLAHNLNADLFLISTAVDGVYLNFGKKDERKLGRVKSDQLRKYLKEGHFPPGSMLPKIKAALQYLERGGKRVIITSPGKICPALKKKEGTHIVP